MRALAVIAICFFVAACDDSGGDGGSTENTETPAESAPAAN